MAPNFDEWPDEPDEPTPESRWGDPEDDLVSIPSVDGPDAADADIEIDGDVAKFFWVAVVYANLAVGGVAVGLLLVGFRQRWRVGGAAVAVGLLALYRTYDVYRTYRTDVADDDSADEAGATLDDRSGRNR